MLTFLLTDIFFYLIIFSLCIYINYVRKTPDIKQTWSHVFKNKTGIISSVVLSFFMLTALLDSIHIKDKLYNENIDQYVYTSEIKSLLDIIILPIHKNSEKSYSAPFSSHLYSKETIKINNKDKRIYTKLLHKGNHNKFSEKNSYNIFMTTLFSFLTTIFIILLIYVFIFYKKIFTTKNFFYSVKLNKFFLGSLFSIIFIIMLFYDL